MGLSRVVCWFVFFWGGGISSIDGVAWFPSQTAKKVGTAYLAGVRDAEHEKCNHPKKNHPTGMLSEQWDPGNEFIPTCPEHQQVFAWMCQEGMHPQVKLPFGTGEQLALI